MAKKRQSAEERTAELRLAADDYQSTVHALCAFAALVCHDGRSMRPDAHFGFGRRMQTSEANRVGPNREVTPDLVAQRSLEYGVVAEVKISLPRDRSLWPQEEIQVAKYDDTLSGWWTETGFLPKHDAVLLLHESRSRPFVRMLEARAAAADATWGGNCSLVEFGRSDQGNSYYKFRLETGEIRDAGLHGALEDGTQVPLQKVVESFGAQKFYDASPNLEYVMCLLWLDYFPSITDQAAVDDASGDFVLTVDASTVTEELQRAYGSHSMEHDDGSATFPKRGWIVDALKGFVRCKLAKVGDEPDTFVVSYRQQNNREDLLLRIVQLLRGAKNTAADTTDQLDLLAPGDASGA